MGMPMEFQPEDSSYLGNRDLPNLTQLLDIRLFTEGLPRNVPVDKFNLTLDRIRGWAIEANGLVVPQGLTLLPPSPKPYSGFYWPTICYIHSVLFESKGLPVELVYKDNKYYGRIFPVAQKGE